MRECDLPAPARPPGTGKQATRCCCIFIGWNRESQRVFAYYFSLRNSHFACPN